MVWIRNVGFARWWVAAMTILIAVFSWGCDDDKSTGPQDNSCVVSLVEPQSVDWLDNGCWDGSNGIVWTFTWDACPDAISYHLYVRFPGASNPAVNKDDITSTSYTYTNPGVIPAENNKGWYWKVRAIFDGSSGEWSKTRTFYVEAPDTDCP
jgi:hypothetical protein